MELQAILKYQDTDKKLYKLERELANSAERKDYVKAKKFLEQAAEKLDAYDAQAKQLKNMADDLVSKYFRVEDTLKDFDHLDELVGSSGGNISFYKKKAASINEQLKKLKGELAALTANIEKTHDEYQKLKKQVIAMQKQYKEAFEKYSAVKASKEDERKTIAAELETLAKAVPADVLQKYLAKRKEKVFPVIVKLQQNCCLCGVDLPVVAQNKLTGGAVIECENCHRIIYNGV